MKIFTHSPLASAVVGWLLLPALVALAQEQPAPAAAPVPVAQLAAPTPTPTVAPAATAPVSIEQPAVEAPAATVATPPADPEKSTLRRLDTETPPVTGALSSSQNDRQPSPKPAPKKRPNRNRGGNDRVSVMGETHVLADEKIDGAAVGVLADVIVDGEVSGDAVAVMGDNTINGTVNGNVVAVLGDVRLGPKARVLGDIICVGGGDLTRAPGAVVEGKIIKKSVGKFHVSSPLQSWWTNGLKLGRPLAFGAGLAWLWIGAACALAFYALLALLFPGGLRRTGDLLVQRPVAVIFSGLLTMIALPLIFVLLLITIVGIPVAVIVLPTGVLLSVLFGKAAIYGLIGRRISSDTLHPSLAVLAGGMIFVLLYLVPVVGLALSLLVSFLGFGCALTALFTSKKKSPPPAPPTAPAASMPLHPVAPMVAPMSGLPPTVASFAPPLQSTMAANVEAPPALAPAGFVPPVISPTPNAALARAGFWIRTAALALDVVLVGMACEFLSDLFPRSSHVHIQADLLPVLALYGALMWKLRGTTVGGIVCGLRVVRLDDRPIDWGTAIVRALGCFLSLIVAGLGFIWVVFDDERQSWHDKMAGTVVVHAPKGTSLV